MEHAAIAVCTVGTILNAVREVGAVCPGERVLVTGAGGGLGMHAVQLAKLAGAEVVALTTSPEKAAQVRDLGADVVVVGRRGEGFSIAVRDATAGHGVDGVAYGRHVRISRNPPQHGYRRPLGADRQTNWRNRPLQPSAAVPSRDFHGIM
jgi:Zn-dependent alcohol dehydrogenase